jgi:hypothetical protein
MGAIIAYITKSIDEGMKQNKVLHLRPISKIINSYGKEY